MHPFVAGELALGPLPNRKKLLAYLDYLPQLRPAGQNEVRQMIEAHSLHNRGIGLIDAHLLAAVLINPGTQLWTRDTSLRKIAKGPRNPGRTALIGQTSSRLLADSEVSEREVYRRF